MDVWYLDMVANSAKVIEELMRGKIPIKSPNCS